MPANSEASRLVHTYSDSLVRFGSSYLGSRADAEDMCQEVLLKLVKHKGMFHDAEHERAWVFRVATNWCKNSLSSPNRRLRSSADVLDALKNTAQPEAESGPITQALSQLPDAQRSAIHLHYYEGFSAAEIATLDNTTTDAVYQRLHRARAVLRELLKEDSHA